MGFQRVRHDCTTKHAQLWYHVYRMECQDLRFERKQAPHNEGLEHYSGMQTLSYATLLNKTFPLQGINDNNAKRNEDEYCTAKESQNPTSSMLTIEDDPPRHPVNWFHIMILSNQLLSISLTLLNPQILSSFTDVSSGKAIAFSAKERWDLLSYASVFLRSDFINLPIPVAL